MNLQMLLNQYEDYVIRRGIWVVDDFEPMLGMQPNSEVRRPPLLPVGKEVYALPPWGQEMIGEPKPFVRENVSGPPAPWHFDLRIASQGSNMSAMTPLLPPEAASPRPNQARATTMSPEWTSSTTRS